MSRLLLSLTFSFLTGSVFAAEPIRIEKSADAVSFYAGKELVTRYHIAPKVAKPYFYPLNAPGSIPVTRAWPLETGFPKETKDHVHQKSGWFCHGDVIPEGIELKVRSADKHVKGVDFWSETPGHGKMVCVEVGEPKVEQGIGQITTKNEWRTPDGIKILDETRTISLEDLGNARLLVLNVDLHASVCPITFGDTKEGAMGIRVSDEMKAAGGNGILANAEGQKVEKSVWGLPSSWNDYSGQVGDKSAGIAIFDDPKNPYRAAWHSRAYGLMAANPFGRNGSGFPSQKGKTDLVKLAKGDHLKLRYGILLHQGNTQEGKVADHYSHFAK
jgi:hypothetical protein